MTKIKKNSGFTAVELLITLFIAAAFLFTGYQLYTLVIKSGARTRSQTRASNIAYGYLQKYKSAVTNPCITQTPINNQSITVANLSNVTITVAITCPYGTDSSISKIQVTLGYGTPQSTVTNATYVGSNVNTGVITNRRVLYLDAADDNSYTGSGITMTDLSTNNNNMTLYNGVGYSRTDGGGALTFDGVDDYVSTGSYSLPLTTAFTVSAWMKFDKYANISNITTGTFGFKWRAAGEKPYWTLYNQAGASIGATTYSFIPNINEWHYYTFTYDGANRSIYIDGILNNSIATSGAVLAPTSLQITASSGEVMSGSISEVDMYDRALNLTEIQQNFDALSGRYGL